LTRARWIENQANTRVIGALLGKQEGKVIEVVNTVEFSFKRDGDNILINEDFAKKRLDAYKQMFGNLQCIGWYTA
jgi:COP9 signalosome complex subunit 6